MLAKRESRNPIAVFDSGMGGVSVLREIAKIMPNEDVIYMGDSANAPYGTRPVEEVRDLTIQHAQALFEEGAKGLVVACNTATSAAVRPLREMYPEIPIVGIEPAVKPAALCGEHPRVLVLATPITIHGEKLKRLMKRFEGRAEIIPLDCPGLMEFVERGELSGPTLQAYLDDLLAEYRGTGIDAAVLGCTHYPFVSDMIRDTIGGNVQMFDGGPGTAREMKRRLEEAGLTNPSQSKGTIEFRNSLPDPKRLELCRYLFHI